MSPSNWIPDPVTSMETLVASIAPLFEERLAPRRRRLLRALADLGLLEAVGGPTFVLLGDEGFAFEELNGPQVDRLTHLLEDLASRLLACVDDDGPGPADHPGQDPLF